MLIETRNSKKTPSTLLYILKPFILKVTRSSIKLTRIEIGPSKGVQVNPNRKAKGIVDSGDQLPE